MDHVALHNLEAGRGGRCVRRKGRRWFFWLDRRTPNAVARRTCELESRGGMRDAGALVLMLVPVCGGADDAGDVEVVVAVAVGVVGVEDVSDVCVVRVAVVAAAVVGGIGGVVLL